MLWRKKKYELKIDEERLEEIMVCAIVKAHRKISEDERHVAPIQRGLIWGIHISTYLVGALVCLIVALRSIMVDIKSSISLFVVSFVLSICACESFKSDEKALGYLSLNISLFALIVTLLGKG